MKKQQFHHQTNQLQEIEDAKQFQNSNSNRKARLNKGSVLPIQDKIISYSRIMPKQLSQDKQYLYSQNIKLKQKIKQLHDQNIRLKTRLNITQNQKQHMRIEVQKFASSADFKPIYKHQKRQQKRSSYNIQTQSKNNLNRRIFRDTKQEIQQLKNQNNRIKKLVKYTQIQQLRVQNDSLLEQLNRMNNYIQSLINNNNFREYQQAIQDLKKKLQQQKNRTKEFPNIIRKKDQEIQSLKEKLRTSQANKVDTTKRMSRQIENLKNYIAKVEKISLKQIKQKSIEKQQSKSGVSKNKLKIEKNYLKIQQDNKKLQQTIQDLKKQIHHLKQQLKKQQSIKQKAEINNFSVKVNHLDANSQQKIYQKKNQKSEQYGQYNDNFQDQEQQITKKNKQNQNQENNYDDDFSSQENKKQQEKNQKLTNSKSNNQNHIKKQQYDIQSDQQQLFDRKKTIEIPQMSKQQKAILKNTITYKFIAQKYNYKQFVNDIKQSEAVSFNKEQLIEVFGNQPFFLSPYQSIQISNQCFKGLAKQEITIKQFLKVMKQYIGQYEEVSQQKQQIIMINIIKTFQQNKQKLKKKFQKDSYQYQPPHMEKIKVMSKNNFIKAIKQLKLTQQQIDICLAQISIMSYDIQHLNSIQFLKRLIESQNQ